MKLTELQPSWLTPDVFIFKSPMGRGNLLCCPRVKMSHNEQQELFEKARLESTGKNAVIVGWEEECIWAYQGDNFNTMSVTPSIDASASGNWHGSITNGEIT